jgi:hypothetical protein
MSKKLSAEEELEKQYRDYRAQFEQWKEKNKNSEGTDPYRAYVQQFEEWEKDVEKRRAAVRQKAQQEREREEKEEEERLQKERDVVAANAYAEQQKAYLAMHQRTLQETENRQKLQRQQAAPQAILQARAQSANLMQMGETKTEIMTDVNSVAVASVMKQVITLMGADPQRQNGEEAIKSGPHIQADPQPAPSQQPTTAQATIAPPPQLWGADANGANFNLSDPLFTKWNVRAAPPNFKVPYQPPPTGTPIVPGWHLLQEMQNNALVFPQQVAPSVPIIPSAMPPPNIVPHGPPPTYSMPPPVGLPPMNVPPPIFSLT